MIAVVMAGGLGTRLHPLTCSLPKPMIPLFERPLLSYIIQKLKQNGFKRVVLTLHHYPEMIMHYFGNGEGQGLQLAYAVEPQPLGTAGSVRHAVQGLGETVVVLSGDVIFEFDLIPALAFHRQREALATMLLVQYHDPRGFGIAALNEHGRVIRYCEKPSGPAETFSNLINTGIYILEPQVLELIPPQKSFDFSRDLFPLLLRLGMPLYGYLVQGSWSDLGTLEVYRQAHVEAFAGRGGIYIPGKEIRPQIWVEEGVSIAPGAELTPPLFLGARACLEQGAVAGPAAVIGADTVLGAACSVRHSILGPGNRVGAKAVLEGALLAANNFIGEQCYLGDMVVLGEACRIGASSSLQNDVKVWPNLELPPCTQLKEAVINPVYHNPEVFPKKENDSRL